MRARLLHTTIAAATAATTTAVTFTRKKLSSFSYSSSSSAVDSSLLPKLAVALSNRTRSHPNKTLTSLLFNADAFGSLVLHYVRAGNPQEAIRTYEFAITRLDPEISTDRRCRLFDILIESLCAERHVEAASEYVGRRKANESGWFPSLDCRNSLLRGWLGVRKLKDADLVWEGMGRLRDGESYGILVEGLCRMRKVDLAMVYMEDTRKEGIRTNVVTCNSVVRGLVEAKRFKEALGMVEKFPLYGMSPDVATYNSLVKGFCRSGDQVGASNVLKLMLGRGIHPTITTYNYFFGFFNKSGRMEDGMNLYKKIIGSGYAPDRLTYDLLIEMSCKEEKVDVTVWLIREMNANGFDSDLETSTVLIHMLCRMNKWEEACDAFEEMIGKGIIPQYHTYRKFANQLKWLGLSQSLTRISGLMNSLLDSKKLPANYEDGEEHKPLELTMSVVKKANAMSEVLKESKERKRLSKRKSGQATAVEKANETGG